MQGKKRTGELQRCIPSITQKVLIQQLRELERDGIVSRTVYNQLPPKVEYDVTEYGTSVNEIIDTMCNWGRKNIEMRQRQGEEIELLDNHFHSKKDEQLLEKINAK